MAEDLEQLDEVFGFGTWLLWLATRATAVVDRAYAAGRHARRDIAGSCMAIQRQRRRWSPDC
jgi:hypothetical protein